MITSWRSRLVVKTSKNSTKLEAFKRARLATSHNLKKVSPTGCNCEHLLSNVRIRRPRKAIMCKWWMNSSYQSSRIREVTASRRGCRHLWARTLLLLCSNNNKLSRTISRPIGAIQRSRLLNRLVSSQLWTVMQTSKLLVFLYNLRGNRMHSNHQTHPTKVTCLFNQVVLISTSIKTTTTINRESTSEDFEKCNCDMEIWS